MAYWSAITWPAARSRPLIAHLAQAARNGEAAPVGKAGEIDADQVDVVR